MRCLDSLLGQRGVDLEVIMVDARSSDGGAVIAKEYAEKHDRLTLVAAPECDLDAARDIGVGLATGDYLVTVDGCDSVPADAYRVLAAALDSGTSQLACGRAVSGRMLTVAQADVGSLRRTHVTMDTTLLHDRDPRRAMFRMSFWKAAGLSYRDAGLMVRAHLGASSVDVVDSAVYHRRRVDGSRPETGLDGWLRTVAAELAIIRDQAPELLDSYQERVLGNELLALAKTLSELTEPEMRRLRELCDRRVVGRLPAIKRLQLHLLSSGRLRDLIEIQNAGKDAIDGAPLVRRGLLRPRWYAAYPSFEDPARAAPQGVYDVTDELAVRSGVHGITRTAHGLRIEGFAYIPGIPSENTDISVWRRNSKSGKRVRLAIERVRRPDVTANSQSLAACHDDSGFSFEIGFGDLGEVHARSSEWDFQVEVTSQGLRRSSTLGKPVLPGLRWFPDHETADGTVVHPTSRSHDFVVQVMRQVARVTAHRLADGRLEVEGRAGRSLKLPLDVVATCKETGQEVKTRADATASEDGEVEFRAFLPIPMAVHETGAGADWGLALQSGGKTQRLRPLPKFKGSRHRVAGGELVLTRGRKGDLRAIVRRSGPVVARVDWTESGPRLSGEFLGDEPPLLAVRHRRTGAEVPLRTEWHDGEFTAELDLTPAADAQETRVMDLGLWDVLARSGEAAADVLIAREAVATLPAAHRVGLLEAEMDTHTTDALCLRIGLGLAVDESGAYRQRKLREEYYAQCRAQPVQDRILFEAYRGRQYSCSPRAVFEELRRRDDSFDTAWLSRHGDIRLPDGVPGLLLGSKAYYEALARARVLVGNGMQWDWFRKRQGQIYVQCWHGTPLKRLGLDLEGPQHARLREQIIREASQWDVLVSPNPFTTEVMRRAYRYDGEVLESGYPRNDVLHAPGAEQAAGRLRERLGIAQGKKVVLYAPTWRDDDQISRGRHRFDLALDLERAQRELGEDHVILLRAHYSTTHRKVVLEDDIVRDVSGYPDMAELLLISDVLITDYSSSMFDFAGTRRPMLFFTYDLERYRDQGPGFCFDFEAEAPGPLLRTSDDVIEAIKEIDDVRQRYASAYDAFAAKFCPYDDGRAAGRVADLVAERFFSRQ
ncbi:MAG: CDP-glycerol:glycerophosphate glycerophosphotransferase [Thermoactinospora sp.]|nr:CDP-glycerol:glycerophosphate glycerophosphotransferase [Thermoactinospora sp.]